MYDICGKRSDGKVINCPFGSPAVKVYLIVTMKFFIFDISFLIFIWTAEFLKA